MIPQMWIEFIKLWMIQVVVERNKCVARITQDVENGGLAIPQREQISVTMTLNDRRPINSCRPITKEVINMIKAISWVIIRAGPLTDVLMRADPPTSRSYICVSSECVYQEMSS